MKNILSAILLLTGVVVFTSCEKDTDPYFQDYYHNKIINLRIESTDMSTSDNFKMTAAAFGVDLNPNESIKLLVNGEEVATKNVEITSDLIKDGCNLSTKDSAWQIIMTYNFINDNEATTVTITPYFNDEGVEPTVIYLDPNKTKSGTLEFKYHK